MVLAGDFTWISFPNPYESLHEMEGFRPGPHLGPKCRQGAPEYQENDCKTKHSGLPISTFPGIHVKPYIIVYVFGTSGAHFREYRVTRRKPLIPIEQEGADLMRFSWPFRAPKNDQ